MSTMPRMPTYSNTSKFRTFEVEFAVGYDHGLWELQRVLVQRSFHYEGDDFEGELFEDAEAILSAKLAEYRDIAFLHPMHYGVKEE